MPPSVPGSLLSLTLTTISNHFKPHRAEALQRIRLNGICLSTLLLSTYLLPLPSVLTALKAVLVSGINEAWTVEWIYKRLCAIGTCQILNCKVTINFRYRTTTCSYTCLQYSPSSICCEISASSSSAYPC